MDKMSRIKLSKNSGYSLIELLAVIFIAGTLMSVMSPYAINWLRRQKIISFSKEMKEFVRLVKSEARRARAEAEARGSKRKGENKRVSVIGRDHRGGGRRGSQ